MPLEHINITCEKASEFAERLCQYFDWNIRWESSNSVSGYTVHVGDETSYLAICEKGDEHEISSLNHIGVVVDDFLEARERITKLGFSIRTPQVYEPGRRFYFDDPNGLEIEVVSYH